MIYAQIYVKMPTTQGFPNKIPHFVNKIAALLINMA